MEVIIAERQGGKTTELFEWLARGGVIETDYCGEQRFIWSRGIITVTEARRGSTKRFLHRWVRMQSAYQGATKSEAELLINAVYTMEEVQEARGAMYRPMSEGLMEFAMDDADTALEHYLGTPLAVATVSGKPYERENRRIASIHSLPLRAHQSAKDESILDSLSFRKGLPL